MAQEQLDQMELPLTEPTPDDSPLPDTDLAKIGPLRVELEEVVEEGGETGLLAAVLQVIPERTLIPSESGLPTPIRSVGYPKNKPRQACKQHSAFWQRLQGMCRCGTVYTERSLECAEMPRTECFIDLPLCLIVPKQAPCTTTMNLLSRQTNTCPVV